MNGRTIVLLCGLWATWNTQGQVTQPLVAIHDSELTRALEAMPASGATPSGPGTTGFQWWPAQWHYFVMPEALEEAMRSDGTIFTVVRDADISGGSLLRNGVPAFPILISLASEAISDGEVGALNSYVAAGGVVLMGSSAFTRNPDGTSRGDFAVAGQLGLHMVSPGLSNWAWNNTLTKWTDHPIISHLPAGTLTWRMPSDAEEIPWGTSPSHPYAAPHYVWQVQASTATVLAGGDTYPYLTIQAYGKGYFIYDAAFQPLIGHGGFAPGMYTYAIFRNAIQWAFNNANLPVPRLSPWPYAYDAAFIVRHDLENYLPEIANIEASAQVESAYGAMGDYYFCTGALREDAAGAYDPSLIIAGLRRAVANYGATIGPHNGGLKNPNNPGLARGDYDYWHWGPDEALDVTPPGYSSGKAYALASVSQSFGDVESWLSGLNSGLRTWVACYFNATREDSYDLQAQAGVNIAGDQKLSPFPHWTVSTRTSGKRYGFLSEPVSDWFVGGAVAQSLEPWHPPGVHTVVTLHEAVDFYYNLGALINFYSHTLATGQGDAGQLEPEYIRYSLDRSAHPRVWSANGVGVYQWWLRRSGANVSANYSISANQSTVTLSIAGAADPNTAVELLLPSAVSNFQVLLNGSPAGSDSYRVNGQVLKLLVGTSVATAQVSWQTGGSGGSGPVALDDAYTTSAGQTLSVPASGVLSNDRPGSGGSGLTAILVSGPANGSLQLNSDGSFIYAPAAGFVGTDSFSYLANDGLANSSPATVIIVVAAAGVLFSDNFTRATDPGPLAPWVAQAGSWSVTGGSLQGVQGSLFSYANAYVPANWTDYSVEAQIQFSSVDVWGGGIGGRLDPVTGAHYAAWVYPEGSRGGASVLKLVKFQTWTTFGYTGSSYLPMQEVSLPGVGTDKHTLKLTFQGNQITVLFDNTQVISATDFEAQPYLGGGITADMWTDAAPYTMSVRNVTVSQ